MNTENKDRTDKIFSFIKTHWILITILLVAVVLRVYFFQGTAMEGQAA